MAYRIPLSFPVFEGNEKLYSEQAISSGHLATYGAFIDKFETKLAKKIKSHEAVALNSGTSALHLAMVLLGIGPGDEVICQSFTFCASANPIVYLGAKPIFVDSETDTWNISPELLEDAILSRIAVGKKPKAIVLVHLFGMPAKIKEVMEISQKYQIPVIEDAAEAVGSKVDGQSCGTFGTIGVYSFNGNKIITSGGGGALLSNDTEIIQRAIHLSTQAREDLPYYQHLEIGYNYKMNNLSAAVGLAQLEQLDTLVEKRRKINAAYREIFSRFDGFTFQEELEDSWSNYWLTTVLIDEEKAGISNDKIRVLLMREGIETRFLWKPLHLQPVFREMPFYGGNISEKLFNSGLCLPSSVNLEYSELEEIAYLIEKEISKSYH
ncbi:aminotransferase class I/II-fold pyridoxal phosphate-dependent enzyme [Algoriphagus machipongonensis]|uniref:General glycosylation pathway protein n=1 Tax=Algoriphagus machipongonensis TaxID=388413 RepID=A3HRS5_9BACT|nr:aminotransferase class I/II-fold pyridoxal phosphate-dependent enzyme [Algoriphagus machipongonensis]EAZ82543.1 general glycosylation pathway protein [Algoriphagus machipongonensis]